MSFWGKIRRRLRMRAQIGLKTTSYYGISKIPAQWVKMSRKNGTTNSNFRSRCFGVVFGPIRAQIRDLRLVSLHKHIVKGVRRPRDRSLRPGHRCVRACSGMSVVAWQQHVGDHGDLIFQHMSVPPIRGGLPVLPYCRRAVFWCPCNSGPLHQPLSRLSI